MSTEDSHPFIWRAARIFKDQSVPFYLNSTCIKRTLSKTVSRENASCNTINCTSFWYDDVPSSTTFAKSGYIGEYLSNVDTLEESLIKNAQRSLNCMAEHTMCQFIDLNSQSNSKSNTEKQRLVEVESRIGRQFAVLNSQIDTLSLSSNERLWSPTLKKEVILLAHHSSFKVTADELNLCHMRDDCIKFSPRTINDCCQRWGMEVHQNVLLQTNDILMESGFDPDSAKPLADTQLPSCPNECDIHEMEVKIQEILDDFTQNHPNFHDMTEALASVELPENSVVLLIDDVSCNRQKEHRDINGKVCSKSAEIVGNTTAVILFDNDRYVITADNTREALTIAIAYMLKHKLLENRLLVTFSDGASEIRKAIPEIFGFHKALKQYLDWYHVRKRINENLESGIEMRKGKPREKTRDN